MITFVAAPERIVAAAVRAVAMAADSIDMRTHRGEHPRLGATDVLPFVPISGVTLEDCVILAHEAGERIARELSIPVYFYERAAVLQSRINLEDVRRGALELLRERQGGLPFVKALGFELKTRSMVQVSMNLVNYEVTGMTEAYNAVRREAEKLGIEVAGAEIVGLVPRNALDRHAEYFSKLENFSENKILENRLESCYQIPSR